jgi:SAM-dependent methyltransferase
MEAYKQPLYYEIAFGFVNPKEQVDNFEKLIKKFSKVEVNRFLDIACGPSLQLREIARRGYEAVGLDSSSQMLNYLKRVIWVMGCARNQKPGSCRREKGVFLPHTPLSICVLGYNSVT